MVRFDVADHAIMETSEEFSDSLNHNREYVCTEINSMDYHGKEDGKQSSDIDLIREEVVCVTDKMFH